MLRNFILLLPCFICLFSAVGLFINRKKNSRPQNIWMLCMALMTQFLFGCAHFYGGIEDFSLYYKQDAIGAALGLTFFPFVHLYFRALTNEKPLGWKEFSWFMPGIFIGVSSVILYAWMGDTQATNYMRSLIADYTTLGEFTALKFKIHYVVNFIFYYVILSIQVVLAIKYNITNLKTYQKRLDDFLSSPDEKCTYNIHAIIKGLFAMLGIYLLGIIEIYFCRHNSPLLIYALMISYATTLYYINYHVSRITLTAKELTYILLESDNKARQQGVTKEQEEIKKENKSDSIIKQKRREEIVAQLHKVLDEDKLFLKNDFRIDDIVQLIQVNRTYISLLINEEYKCSFSDLVNGKRIAYARQLTIKNPKLSQAQIAKESGFTHPSSFSRTFKLYTKQTFKEWRSTIS